MYKNNALETTVLNFMTEYSFYKTFKRKRETITGSVL